MFAKIKIAMWLYDLYKAFKKAKENRKMDDTKKWWESTGVWGGVVAFLVAVVPLFGYQINLSDKDALEGLILGAVGGIGGIIAIIGRVRASSRIE